MQKSPMYPHDHTEAQPPQHPYLPHKAHSLQLANAHGHVISTADMLYVTAFSWGCAYRGFADLCDDTCVSS